jgi:hypothetical protein
MTNNLLQFVEVDGFRLYYPNNLSDSIIDYLKDGKLHGSVGYSILSNYLPKNDSAIIDCGAHIGTFSVQPATEKRTILAIENNQNMRNCLNHTFADYDNVIIEESEAYNVDALAEKHTLKNISAIRYATNGKDVSSINLSKQTISKHLPVLFIEANSLELKGNNSSTERLIGILEDLKYHCFLYNGTNFLIKLDKNSKFPFCYMSIIGMHHSHIISHLGKVTFGAHVSEDILASIIKDNLSINNSQECQDYLESL